MRILALDQASRISGYSIFVDGILLESGKIVTEQDQIGQRLHTLKVKVIQLIQSYNIDTLVIEDIQLQSTVGNNVKTYKVLAEVFGVMEELAADLKLKLEIVHSQTWKSGLGIKGANRPAQKKNAQLYVEQTFNKKVSQDECDAICIGQYFSNSQQGAW